MTEEALRLERRDVLRSVGSLILTAIATFDAGALYEGADPLEATSIGGALAALAKGATFAVPLLAILLTHEFGHWIAARLHRVPATLPIFLPLPRLSPFGTMGAVIGMRDPIASRKALLDVGAAGPLAGLVVALGVLLFALPRCKVAPMEPSGILEGQSLLYLLLKRVTVGPIPDGHDVFLTPTAFAGWAGLLVTALNLLPVGQLDGGHVAYALFGARQNRAGRVVHQLLLVAVLFNLARFLVPVLRSGHTELVPRAIQNSTFWLVWYAMLHLVARVGGRDHPPTEPGPLGRGRAIVGAVTLVLFVLLFMPTPVEVLGPGPDG